MILKFLRENGERLINLEPITKDFPEFGKGGATQAITHKEIKEDKIEHLDLH